MGTAGTPDAGALIDAQNMAEFVTGPWEVNPTLIKAAPFGFGPGAMPLRDVAALNPAIGVDGLGAAAGTHHFIDGYATARDDTDQPVRVVNAVLRFATPADAAAAATDMSNTVMANPGAAAGTPTPMTSQPIPGHPDAVAVTRTITDPTGGWSRTHVHSFTPHGPYVLFQYVKVTTNLADATALVAKTLDLQGPAIDRFQATDPAQLAALPRDPTGVLAKTLPAQGDQGNVNNNATFGPHGELNYQTNPIASAKLFADTGVDVVAHGLSTVIRARDAAAAATIATAAATEVQATGTPADPVPHMPDSRCIKVPGNNIYWCAATADRYEIELFAAQLRDAHQQIAAQYLMLTAK